MFGWWTQRFTIQGRTWCPSHQPLRAAAEVPAEGHALLRGAIKVCPLGPTKEQFSQPDRFQNSMFYWLKHCQTSITVRFLPLSTIGFLSVLLTRRLSPSHLDTALGETGGGVGTAGQGHLRSRQTCCFPTSKPFSVVFKQSRL